MNQFHGPHSRARADLDLLNSRRDGTPVSIGEVTRLFAGNLAGVLAWFAPKPVPGEWAAHLTHNFATTEHLVVAFGYPSHGTDFFIVHDLSMRTVVECPLPGNRIILAGR